MNQLYQYLNNNDNDLKDKIYTDSKIIDDYLNETHNINID